MKNEIQFIHFGNQCPWIEYAKENAYQVSIEKGYSFVLIDSSKQKNIPYHLFTPFSIYLNGQLLTTAPLSSKKIIEIIKENKNRTPIKKIDSSMSEGYLDHIELLDETTIRDKCQICLNGSKANSSEINWYNENKEHIIGCVGYSSCKPVVFIESTPGEFLPYYGFDSDPSIIGMTCIYNNADKDFRKELLNWYIAYLKENTSFKKLRVISGEFSLNPNGNLLFFKKYGFNQIKQLGDLPVKNNEKDSIYLLEYKLR